MSFATYEEGVKRESARIAALPCAICDKPIGPVAESGGHSGQGKDWAHSRCIERITQKTREPRTCKPCGYERTVLVRRSWRGGKDAEESWALLCSACDLDHAAAVHLESARRLRAKAQAIRAKRATR